MRKCETGNVVVFFNFRKIWINGKQRQKKITGTTQQENKKNKGKEKRNKQTNKQTNGKDKQN